MHRVNHASPTRNYDPLLGGLEAVEDPDGAFSHPSGSESSSVEGGGGSKMSSRAVHNRFNKGSGGSSSSSARNTLALRVARTDTLEFVLWLLALVLLAGSFLRSGRTRLPGVTRPTEAPSSNPTSVSTPLPTTLISYSHHETGIKQLHNLEFYLRHGQLGPFESFVRTVYTVSGRHCKLCDHIVSSMGLDPVEDGPASYPHGTVTEALRMGSVTLLRREEVYGWEFANHNVTLEWLTDKSPESLRAVKYFVFVGSSVQGPFLPNYFSHNTHWTQAFTGLLNAHVKLVAPSLVCFPEDHEAGPGARLDTYVFAMDIVGLGVARRSGVLSIHRANNLVVLRNSYGLTSAVFKAGYKVATLLYKYGDSIDWEDPANWSCNDMVPPDRECSYDSITQHPFETVFVKSSMVSRLFLSRTAKKYASWADAKLAGTSTKGRFDMARYRAAIHHHPMCSAR